jgi:hypothetical protein
MRSCLQLRWSSAFNADEDGRRYRAAMIEAPVLHQVVERAVREGRFPAGRRLVVAGSSFGDSRFAWIGDGEPKWQGTPLQFLISQAIAAIRDPQR